MLITNLKLFPVRNASDVESIKNIFNPAMAHQVYGENENIFGYKDLDINVYYSAGPLDVYYDVKYLQKVSKLKLIQIQ